MPPTKSTDIDMAVINVLKADAALKALLPDGVWYDVAPFNSKRYVIVSLFDPIDFNVFGQRAIEDNTYLVKSVGLSTVLSSTQSGTAADLIDDLLDGVTLTIPGFASAYCERNPNNSRIRQSRPDQIDASILWHEAGGFYRVRATLPAA
jgi:hypothetical protein